MSSMVDTEAMRRSLDGDRRKIERLGHELVLKAAAYVDAGLPLADVLSALEIGRSTYFDRLRKARER